MASQRLEKLNDLLRVHVNDFITREIELPLEFFITLSQVEISPDMRHAHISIIVIPDNMRGTALRILRNHTGRLHNYLGKKMRTKLIPKPSFVIDSQLVYGNEMDKLLDEIKENNSNDTL